MRKFEKGDIVRITAKERRPGWNSEGKMDKYIGMLVEVHDVTHNGRLFDVLCDTRDNMFGKWVFESEEAELVYRPSDHSDRYEEGLKDAWEAAKYMWLAPIDGGCSYEDIENMFGTQNCSEVFTKFSPKEAVTILDGYKQKHNDENAKKELYGLIDRFGTDTIYAIVKDVAKEHEEDG